MAGYEQTVRELGRGSERILLQIWAAVEQGTLPARDFPDVAAQVLAVANERGRKAAELAFTGYMTASLGEVSTPKAFAPIDDRVRLTKAFGTIMAAREADQQMMIARLGNSEPLEAAARRFSEAIGLDARATGWIRQMESDACELCVWWWRQGRVWPADHPFQTHKGCVCNPLPVTRRKIASTGYSAKLERARSAARNTQETAVKVAAATTGGDAA